MEFGIFITKKDVCFENRIKSATFAAEKTALHAEYPVCPCYGCVMNIYNKVYERAHKQPSDFIQFVV